MWPTAIGKILALRRAIWDFGVPRVPVHSTFYPIWRNLTGLIWGKLWGVLNMMQKAREPGCCLGCDHRLAAPVPLLRSWRHWLEAVGGLALLLTSRVVSFWGSACVAQPSTRGDTRCCHVSCLSGHQSQRLAFTGKADGDFQISVINKDGSGLVQLARNRRDDHSPVWSK